MLLHTIVRNVTHVFYDCSELRDISQTSTSVRSYDNKTGYIPVVHKTWYTRRGTQDVVHQTAVHMTAAALVVDSVIRVGDATITSSRYVRNLDVITTHLYRPSF